MRVLLLAVLCAVALEAVLAENENEVKRSTFSFMAFLYYSDETIQDNGARFTRSAVLISPDWLISSGDVATEFPQKTLLARVGANTTDNKLTLNEDEDEQEREVIVILRPYNYSSTEWWKTDISLLKTLLPFNITTAVAPATLLKSFDVMLKKCYIFIYARPNNGTERILTQIDIEMLQPTKEQCGNYFRKETMVCGDSNETKTALEPNFCKGNSGGPLVCDNNLIGTQTYINDCQPPHLYQLVLGWKSLIACASEQRYLTHPCSKICFAITKDPPPSITDKAPKIPDIINNMLGDKIDTQPDVSETMNTQIITEETDITTASKIVTFADEVETISSKIKEEIETEVPSTKVTEEHKELMPTKNSVSLEIVSYDTSTSPTPTTLTNAEEESVMESTTEERERPSHIEAKLVKHRLARGYASLIVPSLYQYLLTFGYVLAYT